MIYSLIWLLPVLRGAGLKVVEEPGWMERACRPGAGGEMGRIDGVICHHTATTAEGNLPSRDTLLKGRKDNKTGTEIPGPLAQLALARDGAFHLLGAGRANHAGTGEGRFKEVAGNSHYIGIEAENPIPHTATWPEVQLDAYRRGVAAILEHVGAGVDGCIAHKEYAARRKPVDPGIDMPSFRLAVSAIMNGTGAVRPLIPAVAPDGRRTIRRGDRGEEVRTCQGKVGADPDGRFGVNTEVAVRRFQRERDLTPDGIVGPKTWEALESA